MLDVVAWAFCAMLGRDAPTYFCSASGDFTIDSGWRRGASAARRSWIN